MSLLYYPHDALIEAFQVLGLKNVTFKKKSVICMFLFCIISVNGYELNISYQCKDNSWRKKNQVFLDFQIESILLLPCFCFFLTYPLCIFVFILCFFFSVCPQTPHFPSFFKSVLCLLLPYSDPAPLSLSSVASLD